MDRQASATRADLEYMLINELAEPKSLPFSLLKDVTNDFSDEQEIGQGASAVVYKGSIGNRAIAVKKLYITSTHEDKFKKEIDCLIRVKHKNIVRFLGYCSDAQGFMTRHNGKLIIADTLERLLCFEYLHVGSLDKHITDATRGFEWSQRYQIIVGVCQGLHRLHEDNILHLDLKPGNILLDDNMLPKIADFGLARCLDKDQTKVHTKHIDGTFGYIAPELLGGGAITAKADLYSLGVIITEILTGGRLYDRNRIDVDVLEKWIDRLGESRTNAQLDQIRVCAEIGIECTNLDPAIRPDTKQIIDRLGKTGSTQETQETDKLLRIQPTVLVFRLQSGKLIPCPLQLTNDTDDHVAFKLSTTQSVDWSEHFMTRMPIYGIVPPRSTYTLILTVLEWEVPHKRSCIMVLQSCISANNHIRKFRDKPECDEFFKVNKARNAVHEVELGAFLCQKGQSTPSEPTGAGVRIVSMEKPSKTLYSVDAHPTKQWIITGHDCGHVRIWNHETKSLLDSFKVSQGPVYSVKFIARKQWFISGSAEGLIHVYSYEKEIQKITSFRAHDGLMSLAIHPTQPYVLSSPCSRHHEKKLWNWEKGWQCTQIFEREYFERDFVCQVAFDPKETNRFASTSEYTVKIWDMQMEKYVPNKLQNLMSPVASVFSHPNLPILLTCSSDGTSHFWSSKDFRLEGVLDYGYGGDVRGIACLMASKSKPRCLYVIGQEAALTILDIENENYEKDSVEPSVPQLCTDTGPKDTDSEVITQGSNELLHVHSLKLLFPFQAHKLITCPLHLTNNTDKHVAFRLSTEEGLVWWQQPFVRMPLSGIVPSRSTYTLVVIMREQPNLVQDQTFNLILQSSISGDKYIYTFEDQSVCDLFFEDAKETGNAVPEVKLKAVLSVQGQATSEDESAGEDVIRPLINIWGLFHPAKDFSGALCSLDADPTESWIITGHRHGDVSIWKCGTQRMMSSINTWEETGIPRNILNTQHDVYSVKFITRRRWFLAGTYDGFIHVYNYETRMDFIKRFKVHSSGIRDTGIYLSRALIVHPTKPYVLSTFEEMKLWHWDKDWTCIQTFEREHSDSIRQVAFNPKNTNTFASASSDHTIKLWRLNSSTSEYTLHGHSDKVNCLEFFTGEGQQYLITGSQDCTAKIWGLQEKTCVHTMDVFMSPVVSVISLPDTPYLTTGSEDGTVHLWSCSSFRLERTFNIGCGGPVRSLCLMGSNRVVIQQEGEISIMDIDTISETSASTPSNELIQVEPLELRFPVVQEVSSPLKINNISDHHVAFSIWSSSNRADYNALPTKGVLSPNATVQVVVTRVAHDWVPADLTPEEVLCVKGIVVVEGLDATDVTYDMFKPKTGRIVHEVELDVVSVASQIIPKVWLPWTLDVHPTKPWIMTTQGDYHVHIWNYKTQEAKPIAIKGREVTSAKFIASKQWIMAGCSSGLIYVYSYNPVNKNPVKKILVLQRSSESVSSLAVHATEPSSKYVNSLDVHTTEPSSKSVNSLAVHATEPYVLSAFQDGKILIWNYENDWELMKTVHAKSIPVELVEFNDYGNDSQLMKIFRAKSLSVEQVAFNPKDTDMFASAQDKTIKIWNLHSGECKRVLSGHSGLVVCLDYFHLGDKLHLITGSQDRTAKIWDCETGRCVQTLKGHMDVVNIACCHPDLSILITGSRDGSVRLWDSTTFQHERTLNLDLGEVYAIASLTSSRIAIGNEKGLALVEIDLKDKKDGGVVSTKGLAPVEIDLKDKKDGGVVSTKGLAPVEIDLEDKKDGGVETTKGLEISSSIVSNQLIKVEPLELRFPVAQIVSSTLKICNITDYYVAFSICLNNKTAKWTMLSNSKGVLSPQSTLDVLVRFFFPEKRKSFNPKEVVTVKSTVVTINVTHDMFKTETSRNVELAVFFVASKTISKVKSVSTIDVHPTDTWMVITQGYKSFRMNYCTKEVELVVLKGGEVSLAKFIAREQWILAGFTSGLLCVYSCDSQKRIHVLREHSTSIKSLAIHGTKPYVLSASRDGKILLWDYGKGWRLIKTFYAHGQLDKGDTVEQIVFNPKDTDMFASAQDKTVKIWNLHSGECKQMLSGHSDLVVCLDYFSLGDKLYLITGSQDRTAKIWDCETGSCVQTLKGHTDVVKIACFHPDLLIIITASWDGSVRLWDSTNFRLERTLDFKLGKVNSVAYLKGLTRIAIGHEKGLVLADIRP